MTEHSITDTARPVALTAEEAKWLADNNQQLGRDLILGHIERALQAAFAEFTDRPAFEIIGGMEGLESLLETFPPIDLVAELRAWLETGAV